MNKKADLHTHTTASDGTYTPSQLIIAAKNKKLAAIGITDHETVSGLEEAESAALREGIEFIPGIEISAGGRWQLHILGYFIDRRCEALLSAMEDYRNSRQRRNWGIIEKLRTMGIDISLEEFSENVTVTRANIAALLVKKEICRDIPEAFRIYLGPDGKATVKRERMHPKKCIDIIHCAGGKAFLAHLNQIGAEEAGLRELAAELKGYGLDGLEGYYPEYAPEFQDFCIRLADDERLMISGGSDFHGENKPNILGKTSADEPGFTYDMAAEIKNAVKSGGR